MKLFCYWNQDFRSIIQLFPFSNLCKNRIILIEKGGGWGGVMQGGFSFRTFSLFHSDGFFGRFSILFPHQMTLFLFFILFPSFVFPPIYNRPPLPSLSISNHLYNLFSSSNIDVLYSSYLAFAHRFSWHSRFPIFSALFVPQTHFPLSMLFYQSVGYSFSWSGVCFAFFFWW